MQFVLFPASLFFWFCLIFSLSLFLSRSFRFLKALDLTDDDVDTIRDLWQIKIEQVSKSSDSINSTSPGDSSSAHVSSNSVYLKRILSKPLIQALREIVMKKPADPIEYLGHWLLHYKVSQFLNTIHFFIKQVYICGNCV